MNDFIVNNDFFRVIYCLLVDSDATCSAVGYSGGILPTWLAFVIAAAVVGGVIVTTVLLMVLALIWAERRILARFQGRTGPNRWGPFGLLTPIADTIKLLFKEEITPRDAQRFFFTLAPIIGMVAVLLVFAFIPFGEGIFVTDLNVGLVFLLAVTSLSALSVLIAGWVSGNRVGIFSSLRAIAVLISYEIPGALSLVGIVLIAGSLSLGDIVAAQSVPFIIVQPLAFLIFAMTTLAEINRTPFDLIEAESELGAGHLNDYSGMRFGLLYVSEFIATIAAGAVISTLFLSGWRLIDFIPGPIWFIIKTGIVVFVIIWFRSTWPRLRVDQVLNLAWKGLFELALVNIVVTLIMISIYPQPSTGELWIIAIVNWIVMFVVIGLVSIFRRRSRPRRVTQAPETPPYPVAGAYKGGAS